MIPCEAHRRSVCRIRELKYKCVCKHEQYTAAHAKEPIQPRKLLLHCVPPCGVAAHDRAHESRTIFLMTLSLEISPVMQMAIRAAGFRDESFQGQEGRARDSAIEGP